MVHQSFEGCAPKQNPRISLDFLTDIVLFSSRIIRLVINTIYIYRFLTVINGLRLRGQGDEIERLKIQTPYMCATRHHLSVEPDVIELRKELRKLMHRFKLEVRVIAHTIQHYPHLLFQTAPLLGSSIQKLQCSLDDLELAATFDSKQESRSHIRSKNNNKRSTTTLLPRYQMDSRTESVALRQTKSIPRVTGRLRRLEADEEQVYLIARNIHLALHTLMINAKLIHLTTKNGHKASASTLLFPFLYDIGRKFCLSFYYLQLLSKYISHRAVQTENQPVPPLTDFRVNHQPANRNIITEANQFLVDNFARTVVKNGHVRFNVATQQCLPSSILTRRFSNIKNSIKSKR